ncbi:MAG: hypothetical protein ACOY5F_18985 [Pseudomonadota bacterium]
MTIARWALAGLLVLSAAPEALAAAAKKQPSRATGAYDGLWSVLIITEKGTCDRGYRYAVRIKGGRVGHADPANSSFKISGSVGSGGAARVSVARGNQSAAGTGRLTSNSGAGRWKSSKGECSGIWQAERRGS